MSYRSTSSSHLKPQRRSYNALKRFEKRPDLFPHSPGSSADGVSTPGAARRRRNYRRECGPQPRGRPLFSNPDRGIEHLFRPFLRLQSVQPGVDILEAAHVHAGKIEAGEVGDPVRE
jgi:hypothetical protein